MSGNARPVVGVTATILARLRRERGRTVTHWALIRAVYGWRYPELARHYVYKAIMNLRRRGHRIAAKYGRGYRLEAQ